jgi:leucyl aminopeptidase
LADASEHHLQAAAQAVADTSYVYTATKPSAKASGLKRVVLALPTAEKTKAAKHEFDLARAQVAGVALAKEWGNRPANHATPTHLAGVAKELGKKAGIHCQVLGPKEIEKLGMGSFAAVARGSVEPLRFIVLQYTGAAKSEAPTVLVGKGITFDTGGLSLKPSDAMVPMKTDMSGSASVLAAMQAIAQIKPNVEVIGLLAIAENAISGSAMRPGDVITHFGGTTVEVRNTDAEGRLVLADALAYADQELNPDVIVDLATLTGAASLGLGRIHGAMYATSDAAASRWLTAADAAGEPVWRLPLVDEYEHALESDIADVCHISTDPHVGAGSITAALFLRRFVGRRVWLHLDIAGPARSDADRRLITRGGTAYGTASLIRWVESFSA